MSQDQLTNALSAYIQMKEVATHNNKKKASGEEKKKLEEFEENVILLMEQFNLDVRQVGNKYVSIEVSKKPAKLGKDFDIECFATYMKFIMQAHKKRTGKTNEQIISQFSELFNMSHVQIPNHFFEFKEEFRLSQGTTKKSLKITDKRPYQQIVNSLMSLD